MVSLFCVHFLVGGRSLCKQPHNSTYWTCTGLIMTCYQQVMPRVQILDNNSFSLARALEIDPQFLDTATSSDEEDADAAAEAPSATAHANAGGGSSVAGPSSAMVGEKRGMHGHGSSDDMPPAKSKKPRRVTRALHDLNFVRSIGILLPGALDNYLFNMFMRDLLLVRLDQPCVDA